MGRWEQPAELIPAGTVCKPALAMTLCWCEVSSQPTMAPWLHSSCSSLPANPAGWGSGLGDGWASVEGTLVPQRAPALVHRRVLGWAGQKRELCRDGPRALLAMPLQLPAGSSRLEQGFSCPESSHGILLGSSSG